MPSLFACHFDFYRNSEFDRLARVLAFTAAAHCPSWTREVVVIPSASPTGGTGVSGHIVNVHKFTAWVERVRRARDGDALALLDADVAILRPLDDVWNESFDLAYTTRTSLFPFNLGVLFVRVSAATRALFDALLQENRRVFTPGEEQRAWRAKYGGINQAAFGALLERGGLQHLRVRELPCAEWNCEESAWPTFDPAIARILHVKGTLRNSVFMRQAVSDELRPLVTLWRNLDRDASHAKRIA